MYASLGLFAVVFVLHGVYLYGFAVQRRRLALEWMTVMALLNLLGAMFYALRVSGSVDTSMQRSFADISN
jgi:adiponectin receptor